MGATSINALNFLGRDHFDCVECTVSYSFLKTCLSGDCMIGVIIETNASLSPCVMQKWSYTHLCKKSTDLMH